MDEEIEPIEPTEQLEPGEPIESVDEAEPGVTRVEKDILKFKENMKSMEPEEGDELLFEMASRYCKDAEYHLKKGDVMTAFGCITYAHGLIDSLKYRKP